MVLIRPFQAGDRPAIQQLFYETVRQINCRDYDAAQIDAWSASAWDNAAWQTRLQNRLTYVAEENQQIVGFVMLKPNGYIDCFYCHHQHQGKGIGSQLLDRVETTAHALGIQRLFSEVSLTAKPFFQRRGYTIVRAQQVERRGVQFHNVVMEKQLAVNPTQPDVPQC